MLSIGLYPRIHTSSLILKNNHQFFFFIMLSFKSTFFTGDHYEVNNTLILLYFKCKALYRFP